MCPSANSRVGKLFGPGTEKNVMPTCECVHLPANKRVVGKLYLARDTWSKRCCPASQEFNFDLVGG